jgi:hypothetical protein
VILGGSLVVLTLGVIAHPEAATDAQGRVAPAAVISGTITDAVTRRVVQGAVVELTDLGRSVRTGDTGGYAFTNVSPGPQHVAVRAVGYAPRMIHALVPAEGSLQVGIALTPLPQRLATVDVESWVPVRGARPRAERGLSDRVTTIAEIRHHPLLAEPDVLEGISGGGVSTEPEAPSGVHVRGAAADQTAYLLDGIPVLSPYHAAGLFASFNPDAVASVELWSASTHPGHPAALAGVFDVSTKQSSPQVTSTGSVSATQARLLVDGPIGDSSGTFLLSVREGFPGLISSARDASHLRGESGDRLGTVDIPLGAGRLHLLAYGSGNALSAAAVAGTELPPGAARDRNRFEWESASFGGAWSRAIGPRTIAIRAWRATSGARAAWSYKPDSMELLASSRRDIGALIAMKDDSGRGRNEFVVRVERQSVASRKERAAASGETPQRQGASIWSTTGFARRSWPIADALALDVDAAVTLVDQSVALSPGATLRWTTPVVTLEFAVARRRQLLQSLRNEESLVGAIFPAELWFAGDSHTTPRAARADQAVVSAQFSPWGPVRVSADAFLRRATGVLVTAAGTSDPYATERLRDGTARARGFALYAASAGRRYGAIASYAWQSTWLTDGTTTYQPRYAVAHRVEGGATLFPTPTLALRVGAVAMLGRRTTPMFGPLEWESCNLLDFGCEFGGSPRTSPDSPGSGNLPAYVRLDAGVRRHWHLRVRQRDLSVALFGTITNLLSRSNTLAYTVDGSASVPTAIGMRPLAPLVVGVDWRF